MDMKPQKPILRYQRWYRVRRVRSNSMDIRYSEREDDLPFNSVIKSARWRALKERRISVGQIKWRINRQRRPNLIMEKWPVSDARSFACFS